jgi:hypothetical protein
MVLPQTVGVERHYIVHCVILLRYGGEDVADFTYRLELTSQVGVAHPFPLSLTRGLCGSQSVLCCLFRVLLSNILVRSKFVAARVAI